MDINQALALVQFIGIIIMVIAYTYQNRTAKTAVEQAIQDLHKTRYEHEGAIVLLKKARKEYLEALAKVEAQPKINMQNIKNFMDQYEDLHQLMKQTLHDESYAYVLETNPQEAELIFTWILKNGYTVINTSTRKEPILKVMLGVEEIITDSINGIYNTRVKAGDTI